MFGFQSYMILLEDGVKKQLVNYYNKKRKEHIEGSGNRRREQPLMIPIPFEEFPNGTFESKTAENNDLLKIDSSIDVRDGLIRYTLTTPGSEESGLFVGSEDSKIKKLADFVMKLKEKTANEIEEMLPQISEFDHLRDGDVWKILDNYLPSRDRENKNSKTFHEPEITLSDVVSVFLYSQLVEISKTIRKKKPKKRTQVYEKDGLEVHLPRNSDDACDLGKGSKWCISSRGYSHFNNYRNGGSTFWFVFDNKERYGPRRDNFFVIEHRNDNFSVWWPNDTNKSIGNLRKLISEFPKLEGIDSDIFRKVYEREEISYLDKHNKVEDRLLKKLIEDETLNRKERERRITRNKLDFSEDFYNFNKRVKKLYIENKHELPESILNKIQEKGGKVNKDLINSYVFVQGWKIPESVYKKLSSSLKTKVFENQLSRLKELYGGPFISRNRFHQDELRRYINDDVEIEGVKAKLLEIKDMRDPSDEFVLTEIQNNPSIQKQKSLPNKFKNMEELQKRVVKKNPKFISKIKNPSQNIQILAVQNDVSVIKDIKNPTVEVQMNAIRTDSESIKYIVNPQEDVQVAALLSNLKNVKNIKVMNPNAIAKVLNTHPNFIKEIKSPTPEQEAIAVKNNPSSIQYIDKPNKETIMIALRKNPKSIDFVKDASKETVMISKILDANNHGSTDEKERKKLALIREHPFAIRHIRNPSVKLKFEAVRRSLFALKYIENPPEDLQLAAIEKNPHALEYIKNPTEKAQEAAIEQDPFLIKTIKRPSKAVQLAAVQKYPKSIKMIQKPYPEVVKYVEEHHT